MGPKLGALFVRLCFLTSSFHLLPTADTANIVFFLGISSYSHRVPISPIAEGLAENGHNITFISPYSNKNPHPKIRDYVPRTLKKWVESWKDGGFMQNVFEERKQGASLLTKGLNFPKMGIKMCEELYKDEDYIGWVKSTKVDLLILDALFNDCAYGMAHYWGAKVIAIRTAAPFGYYTDSFGLADETCSIPSTEMRFPADMSFGQRLMNALIPIVSYYYRHWAFYPKLEAITREKLGIEDVPKFEELERNTSLLFLNIHYGEEFPRSLPPNIVPIGGIAISEERKPLPKELEAFLENGNGFIYMSFGTYADFAQMDQAVQQAFIRTMKSLSHLQFVWKAGNESLGEEFPDKNVFVRKWMPQQDILAHPKIKAFITHSGLIGIQEAVYNAVPLISFPIFAEQDYNAERIHRKEYGIRLEITTITQPQLEYAIRRIIADPRYRNNMKKVSMLFKERPQKPLDTALWWTEFVLRHSKEELAAMRPLNLGEPWWKRRQLDVWATIFISVGALFLSLIYTMCKLLRCIFSACAKKSRIATSHANQKKKLQ